MSACRSMSSSGMPVGGILTTGACSRAAPVVRRLAEPQIVGRDVRALGQQHRALDRVLELADVARPVVAHQQLLRVGLEPVDLLLQLAGEPADEERRPAARCRPCARAAAASRSRRRSAGSRGPRGTGPSATIAGRSRLVAAMSRTSTRSVRVPPRRSNSCSCSTRRILACVLGLMSPISSRNSVPPSACSKRPMRCLSAPVNAPFSWPKSSDSSRFSCSAAQFTLTKLRAVAQRVVVDRAGDELLAGARFAADEHRRVALRDLLDDVEHALQRARSRRRCGRSRRCPAARAAEVVELVLAGAASRAPSRS